MRALKTYTVSTHSRPKAAAYVLTGVRSSNMVSTHSRPKAAAVELLNDVQGLASFNSQPPEGSCRMTPCRQLAPFLFQLTAARRQLQYHLSNPPETMLFQLTAARRQLRPVIVNIVTNRFVSTHSRPKAAAQGETRGFYLSVRFNSQPPEGSCLDFDWSSRHLL